ncbi:MAG: hypothetical protein HRS50_02385 [Mycoplasmataceae bacterium]|nr:hypothetical protein [Mycoplasmataceae bacterium]
MLPIIILISGVVFGTCSFNWKNSTLHKNFNITGNNSFNFHISILVIMLIVGIISLFLMIGVLFVWDYLGLLLLTWMTSGHKQIYNFKSFPYGEIIYVVILIILINFSISFALQYLIKNQKTYYVIVLCFLILEIIFGGGLNNYFGWYSVASNGQNYVQFSPSMFPALFFIPSLFFPFYSPTQLFASLSQTFEIGRETWSGSDFSIFYLLPLNNDGMFHSRIDGFNTAICWNIIMILPYVYISLFGVIGVVLSKIKRSK